MDNSNRIFSINDILVIILKRRWLILVPLFLSLLVGICMSLVLPRIYQAETLILVEPQRVPSSYVQSLVSSDIETRINTISQQIMSRTSLEKIINDFGLFNNEESRNLFIEEKLEIMRKKIAVRVTRSSGGANAFSITFKDQNPDKVANVVNALATYFIDENLKVREAQAVGTSDFLEDELLTMRQRLELLEGKLKSFRETYMGELPEQLETNLRLLDRLQEQLTEQQALMREAKGRMASLMQPQQSGQESFIIYPQTTNAAITPDGQSLADLRRQLDSYRGRYTEEHPDVVRVKKLIQEMEIKQATAFSESKENPSEVERPEALSPAAQVQLFETRREISGIESNILDLKKEINFYQQRVENTPKREQELLALNRDYSNIQEAYSSLLTRKLESEIAVNMERKQKGEQFRIIDTAKKPEKAVEPNMLKLFIFFVFLGVLSGGGIVFAVEYVGDYFRNPDDVEAFLGLPVIGSLPHILQPKDKFRKQFNDFASLAMFAMTFFVFVFFAAISFSNGNKVPALIKKLSTFI